MQYKVLVHAVTQRNFENITQSEEDSHKRQHGVMRILICAFLITNSVEQYVISLAIFMCHVGKMAFKIIYTFYN